MMHLQKSTRPRGFQSRLCILGIIVVSTTLAHSQDTMVRRDASAIAELDAAYANLNGVAFSSHPHVTISGSVVIEGATSGSPVSGHFKEKIRGRDFQTITNAGGHLTVYSNLRENPILRRDDHYQTLPPWNGAGRTSGLFPVVDRWVDYRLSTTNVRTKDDLEFHGVACHHLLVEAEATQDLGKRNQHGVVDVYINAATGALWGIEYKLSEAFQPHSSVKVAFLYDHFLVQDGVTYPSQVTRILPNNIAMTFTISHIDLSRTLVDSDFDPTTGGAGDQ